MIRIDFDALAKGILRTVRIENMAEAHWAAYEAAKARKVYEVRKYG